MRTGTRPNSRTGNSPSFFGASKAAISEPNRATKNQGMSFKRSFMGREVGPSPKSEIRNPNAEFRSQKVRARPLGAIGRVCAGDAKPLGAPFGFRHLGFFRISRGSPFFGEADQVRHELNHQPCSHHDARKIGRQPAWVMDYLQDGGGTKAGFGGHLARGH